MIYEILPEKTALLVIDPQREYFDQDKPLYTPNADSIRGNLIALQAAAKFAGVTTILVLHCHKADGSDVGRMGDFDPTPVFVEGTDGVEPIEELKPGSFDIVIQKTRYSAFSGTNLHELLRKGKLDTVIVTGLMTNFCCVSTARTAHDLDYKTIFVRDACSGPDLPDLGFGPVPHSEIMRVVASSMAAGIADVIATKEVLGKLQHLR